MRFRCVGISLAPTLEKSVNKDPGRRGEPHARARRLAGAVVASLLAVGSSVFFAPAAQAASVVKTITTDRFFEAWYWSSNQDLSACTPTLPVAPPPGVPGGLCNSETSEHAAAPISPGHLGISVKAGTSDMRSYILFDLSFIPVGSTLNSMVATFTVSRIDPNNTQHTQEHSPEGAQLQQPDTQPKPPATVNDSGVGIDACLLNVGFGNTEGGPPTVRDPNNPTAPPTPVEPAAQPNGVDTKTCVHGVGTATTWSFDLTPLAQKWVSGAAFNNGIALLPVIASPVDNWTVELHGAYYASAITDPTSPDGTGQQVFVSKNEEAKAKVDYIPAAVVPPVTPPLPAAAPPVPAGAGGPPSVVTLPSAPLPTPVPPAVQQTIPVSRPTAKTPWYVWLLLPAGIAGFLTLSTALGREAGEQAVNRVANALRRRHGEVAGA